MSKETITLEKRIITEQTYVYFKYEGEGEIKGNIKQLFDGIEKQNNKSIIEYIAWIRTTLQQIEEKNLMIIYQNDKQTTQIEYNNKKLKEYHTNYQYMELNNTKQTWQIDYEVGKNWNISIDPVELAPLKASYQKKVLEQIDLEMKVINKLNDILPITLKREEKQLCEIYKYFYGTYPNFKDPNIGEKMQSMIFIINEYGIFLNPQFSFVILNANGVPYSVHLQDTIERLFPLGSIQEVKTAIKLSKENKKMIQTIGQSILENIQPLSLEKQIETLQNISRYLYTSHYKLSSKAPLVKVASKANCSVQEIEAAFQLVKTIEHNLNSVN